MPSPAEFLKTLIAWPEVQGGYIALFGKTHEDQYGM
jgi:hypothetical protein